MKVADDFILVKRADGTVDDFFESFLKAMEGNPSLMKHADDASIKVGGDLEELTPNAKARLKHFLSDPDAGNPWKLDDPQWVAGQDPPIPHNYFARGNLLELQQFKKIYKQHGFTHHPNAAGFDYKRAGNQPAWAQMKTVADPTKPNAIERMKVAIDDLVSAASGANEPLILHVLTRDSSITPMETALKSYLSGKPYESRFTLLIQQFVYP